MTRHLLFILSSTAGCILLAGGASAAARLPAHMCQPLLPENRSMCCQASNWQRIVLPWQQHLCDRDHKDNRQGTQREAARSPNDGGDDDGNGGSNGGGNGGNGGNGGGGGGGGNGGNGGGGEPTETRGNPGNAKPVGRAGEKGMDDEVHATIGTRGASNRGE